MGNVCVSNKKETHSQVAHQKLPNILTISNLILNQVN